MSSMYKFSTNKYIALYINIYLFLFVSVSFFKFFVFGSVGWIKLTPLGFSVHVKLLPCRTVRT